MWASKISGVFARKQTSGTEAPRPESDESSPLLRLPNELLDRIVLEVGMGSPATLDALTRTSRALREKAGDPALRRKVFRELAGEEGQKRDPRLLLLDGIDKGDEGAALVELALRRGRIDPNGAVGPGLPADAHARLRFGSGSDLAVYLTEFRARLEAGAPPRGARCAHALWSPMFYATFRGTPAIMGVLVGHGGDVNQCFEGKTFAPVRLRSMLMGTAARAPIRDSTMHGRCPLDLAIGGDDRQAIDNLLPYNPRVDASVLAAGVVRARQREAKEYLALLSRVDAAQASASSPSARSGARHRLQLSAIRESK